MKKISLLISALLLSACSVNYSANPVTTVTSKEICIIENPAVRNEFLIAYKKVLDEKGFNVRIIAAGSPFNSCQMSSTYIGKWSWDFKFYMATAEIKVYEYGQFIANATYSSPRGGWSMTTKIYESTETKVRAMVQKLFPE